MSTWFTRSMIAVEIQLDRRNIAESSPAGVAKVPFAFSPVPRASAELGVHPGSTDPMSPASSTASLLPMPLTNRSFTVSPAKGATPLITVFQVGEAPS
jgi:hypothetical protein